MLDLELDSMLYDIHVFWHIESKLFLSWDDILKKLKIIVMVCSWVGKEKKSLWGPRKGWFSPVFQEMGAWQFAVAGGWERKSFPRRVLRLLESGRWGGTVVGPRAHVCNTWALESDGGWQGNRVASSESQVAVLRSEGSFQAGRWRSGP